MWCLNPVHGLMIEEDREFVEAVRVRLGCGGPPDLARCACCSTHYLDTEGAHASGCSTGEATVGHNAIRDVVYTFCLEADAAPEKEPTDLVSSRPRARHADVFTSAATPGREGALDVGVTTPAVSPGGDALQDMYQRKLDERIFDIAELA